MIDPEEYAAVLDELETHIKDFVRKVDGDDQYLLAWELIVHKTSTEMEREQTSALGLHGKADMTFVERRGLLALALQTDEDRTRG